MWLVTAFIQAPGEGGQTVNWRRRQKPHRWIFWICSRSCSAHSPYLLIYSIIRPCLLEILIMFGMNNLFSFSYRQKLCCTWFTRATSIFPTSSPPFQCLFFTVAKVMLSPPERYGRALWQGVQGHRSLFWFNLLMLAQSSQQCSSTCRVQIKTGFICTLQICRCCFFRLINKSLLHPSLGQPFRSSHLSFSRDRGPCSLSRLSSLRLDSVTSECSLTIPPPNHLYNNS